MLLPRQRVLPAARTGCRKMCLRRCPLLPHRALSADHLQLSEEGILLGSLAISLAVPAAWTWWKNRIEETTLQAAVSGSNGQVPTLVLDIRTQEQREAEGIPELSSGAILLHSPWMMHAEGTSYCRLNPQFIDDVLHLKQAHTQEKGARLIVLDRSGECGVEAAKAVAKVATRAQVQVARGGFAAWQAAGLPTRALTSGDHSRIIDPDDVTCVLEPEPATEAIFRPKLLDVLTSGYTTDELKNDVLSGLVVGVIALSLSMALGIASESTPAVGLTTAVVSGSLASLLGGSRVSITGPTAAFIPIVVGVAHTYGLQNLVICTGMSGLMLIAAGTLKMGDAIKFIPKPIVTGFTAGIATYIFSTQIKDFLGLGVPGALPEGSTVPAQFVEKLYFLGHHLDSTHLPSLALATASLGLMLFWPKPWAKVAPPQIVTVVSTAVGLVALDYMLHGSSASDHTAALASAATTGAFGIETIGSHFGADAIPSGLPAPHMPEGLTSVSQLGPLLQPALSIAILGSIESLLCARVSDSMIGDKHNPNTELIAQGVANVASAAFGGLPATGALARTAANVRSGGRSPVAGIVHAATIYTVMVVAAPYAAYIPLPALSAMLVMVAINMGEWRHFRQLTSWPEKDAQLYLLAFFLTVMQDVAVAVEVGMAAAVALYVRDVTGTLSVRSHEAGETPHASLFSQGPLYPSLPKSLALTYLARRKSEDETVVALTSRLAFESDTEALSSGEESAAEEEDMGYVRGRLARLQVPQGAAYLDVTGSLLFGGGEQLDKAVRQMERRDTRVLVLGMSALSTCDVSGLEVLEELAHKLKKRSVGLVLVGLTQQPLQMLSRAGFLQEVGSANVCRTLDQAFTRASELIGPLPANNVVVSRTNRSRSQSPSPPPPPPSGGQRARRGAGGGALDVPFGSTS